VRAKASSWRRRQLPPPGTSPLRVQAKVAIHPFEQGGIDVGLGSVFARRVRFAAGPDNRPRLQHRSGSLDAGVRLSHQDLRQGLARTRCILQLAEKAGDPGDLLVETRLSSRTQGSGLGASALELVMDPEIDDFSGHETCIPRDKSRKTPYYSMRP
jgi:hypothetical protein